MADPMERRQCTAKSKQSGQRCKRAPVVGGTVCAMHGGKAPQVAAAAEQREVERQAGDLLAKLLWNPGADPIVDSVGELRQMSGSLKNAVNVLGTRLSGNACEFCGRGAEPLDGPTAAAWMRGIREQRQLLVDMKRLGLEEHAIELQKDQAQLVTSAFLAAIAAVSSLLPADRDLMLRTFLSGLGRGPEVLEAGGAA